MHYSTVKSVIACITALALLSGQVSVAQAAPRAAKATAAPVAVPEVPDVSASPAPVEEAAPFETEKQRAARLKAEERALAQAAKSEQARLKAEEKARVRAEKEAQARLKAEERQRRQAENRKKGGGKTGKAILGCVVGGGLAALIGAAAGMKRDKLVGIAMAGCVAGIAFATLSKKDNEQLNTYVDDEFLVQDEACDKVWHASESKQNVNVACGDTTYRQASHSFFVEDDIVFDAANIQVAESVRYATNSVRLRSAPTTGTASTIIGGFNRGDKIRTYGTTLDGKWAYIVEKLPGGGYELLGYASSGLLAAKAPSAAVRTQHYARLQSSAKGTQRAAVQRTAANSAAKPAKQVKTVANTRCKTANISVGSESKSKSSCGGAQLALYQPKRGKEKQV